MCKVERFLEQFSLDARADTISVSCHFQQAAVDPGFAVSGGEYEPKAVVCGRAQQSPVQGQIPLKLAPMSEA